MEPILDLQAERFEPIDIEMLLARISPDLAKKVPRFVFRYIKKVLHLEDVNRFFSETFDFDDHSFLVAARNFLNIDLNIINPENLEALRGQHPVIASNHPIGGPESMSFLGYLLPMFPSIKLLAQNYLSFIKPLRTCCVFNKKGIATMLEVLRRQHPLLIYPSGKNSRPLTQKRMFFDPAWVPSFIKFAKNMNAPIVVCYTAGITSRRWRFLARFSRFFKLKLKVENLYLVDEMFRQRGKTITITVGKPIDPEIFDDSQCPEEWAQRLRQYSWILKTDPDAVFNPSLPATLALR